MLPSGNESDADGGGAGALPGNPRPDADEAGPARVLGIDRKIAAGQPADLTLFSVNHSWTYHVKDSASKSRNSPFDGRAFKGGPMATIVAGKIVFKR